MKLDLYKTLKLDFLGKGWEQCEVTYRAVSVGEAMQFVGLEDEKALESSIKLIQDKFVKGTALSDGKEVELKASDLTEFPTEFIAKSLTLLVGDVGTEEIEKKDIAS